MPIGRTKRKTTIRTARKVWSWFIVVWLCPDCFWSGTFVRSSYTWLHEIPHTLKARVSQLGRQAVRLESPPRQEKGTSPIATHLSDPARQLPDRQPPFLYRIREE